jgi:hypothetical protein
MSDDKKIEVQVKGDGTWGLGACLLLAALWFYKPIVAVLEALAGYLESMS